MGREDEYLCRACKKEIHIDIIKCMKMFHPGCIHKHKVYNSDNEIVTCEGAKENFRRNKKKEKPWRAGSRNEENIVEVANEEKEESAYAKSRGGGHAIPKTIPKPTTEVKENSDKEYLKKNEVIETSVEQILKIVQEIKNTRVSRNEIRKIVDEAIGAEVQNLRQEIEDIKKTLLKINNNQSKEKQNGITSYSEATKAKRSESILIVKPKGQQESETTKNTVLEKIKIKTLPIGVSRLTKGNNGTIIIGCENGKEVEKLKTSVETTIGKDFETIIPRQKQPKIKIIGIDKEEMELTDELIVQTIKVQNELS